MKYTFSSLILLVSCISRSYERYVEVPGETRSVWIYNPLLNKCLLTGSGQNMRPLIKDCDDSEASQWEIPVSGDGFYKSLENGLCLWKNKKNVLGMGECNENSIIKDIKKSYQKYSISFSNDSDRCLGLYKDLKDGRSAMNKCNDNEDQEWQLWNRNPSKIVDNTYRTVWIYNPKLNKCLFTGGIISNRPLIKDCDDSEESQWKIPVSGEGFYKSIYNDLCLWKGERKIFYMRECDENSIMEDIKKTYKKHSISFSNDFGRCLGLYKDLKDGRSAMNECDKTKEDQEWEIWDRHPTKVLNNNTKTRFVQIYNPKLNKCLVSDKKRMSPTIKDCNNSNNSKWEVPVSGDGFYKSVSTDNCLWSSIKGNLAMGDCNGYAIIKDIQSSDEKNTISFAAYPMKCLGFKSKRINDHTNMNSCDKSMEDQIWELREVEVEI